ncbi:putative membrane protein [Halapricum desulfuricans]|uniref:Putative membrane protein n=1 Tax=Halapricum desulfuricans TaxID=2841257 RepID=A0A897NKB7_9EURY|nr:hypothetical protein [Halapricum desulfuricans]QSG13197.1 putative membrane protein [Halapricum desulfuricans]
MTDREAFERAVSETPRFVYHNGLRMVLISVGWVVFSLPLVTIGPATLVAYRAILDVRSDRNRIEWGHLMTVLKRSGLASVLLSGAPVVFAAVAVTYGLSALRAASLAGEILALSAGYVALYLALVLMPTFVAMANGYDDFEAVMFGVRWTAEHPTAALTTGLLTVAILAATVLLTVAFVLVFAALAFTLQIEMVTETTDIASTED